MKTYTERVAWYLLRTPRERHCNEAASHLDVFRRALARGFDVERIAWHEPTVEGEFEMFLGRAC